MVITIQVWFDLTIFREYFSMCTSNAIIYRPICRANCSQTALWDCWKNMNNNLILPIYTQRILIWIFLNQPENNYIQHFPIDWIRFRLDFSMCMKHIYWFLRSYSVTWEWLIDVLLSVLRVKVQALSRILAFGCH